MRALGVAVLLIASCAAPGPRPLLERGLVAAPEPHASEAGAAVLRDGGNAVDAAIAIQFALAVTFPNAGNLGGGGFMLVHTAAGETSIDYRETAPAAAHRDLYLDAAGDVVPGLSLDTAKAAGVPGTVAGMWLAHRRFGSLPWKRLLEPAIRLADEGWVLDRWSAASFARERRNNFHDYFRGAAGGLLVQKELAAALRRIAERGRDGFYLGETSALIVEEMKRSGGIIAADDLARYEAKERKPIEGSYRGLRVVSMAPPSSGGVALLQLLNMMEPREIKPLGFHSPAHLHLVAEIEKRVFADRTEHLGDPDFVGVPVRRLIAKDYAAERMKGFSPDGGPIRVRHPRDDAEGARGDHPLLGGRQVGQRRLQHDDAQRQLRLRPRRPRRRLPAQQRDGRLLRQARRAEPLRGHRPRGQCDRPRQADALVDVPDVRLPRRRPLAGARHPGGPTIFTTVFQVIVNRVDFGVPLAEAVAAARFHHQWPPLRKDSDPIFIEQGSRSHPRRASRHGLHLPPRGRIGDVQAIEIQRQGRIGASDPRGIGESRSRSTAT
jgi:gamma-glutamyltranspeptidase/glutathione hydrolase